MSSTAQNTQHVLVHFSSSGSSLFLTAVEPWWSSIATVSRQAHDDGLGLDILICTELDCCVLTYTYEPQRRGKRTMVRFKRDLMCLNLLKSGFVYLKACLKSLNWSCSISVPHKMKTALLSWRARLRCWKSLCEWVDFTLMLHWEAVRYAAFLDERGRERERARILLQ